MKLEERNLCRYSGIYKITNKENGHSYVGQAKNIDRRIYFHLLSTITETRSDYNYPLHIAIRKYGLDAFELDILEKCSIEGTPQQQADELYALIRRIKLV